MRDTLTPLGRYVVDKLFEVGKTKKKLELNESFLAGALDCTSSELSMHLHHGKYHRCPKHDFIVRVAVVLQLELVDLEKMEELWQQYYGRKIRIEIDVDRRIVKMMSEMPELLKLPENERFEILRDSLLEIYPKSKPINNLLP